MRTILNMNFCGTQLSAARAGQASVEAIKKFNAHVILTGVGAKSITDKDTKKYYPTPGTFEPKIKDREIVAEKRTFHLSENFFTGIGAGLIYGAGEEDNIELAMKHLDAAMEGFTKNQKVRVNLSGFSRGGASAIKFANAVFQKYGSQVQLNLFLIEPTGGLGRLNSPRKINIPPNVNRIHFSFARDEKHWIYTKPNLDQYVFANPQTKITSITFEGGHLAQELQQPERASEQKTSWQWTDAGKTNNELVQKFLFEHEASPIAEVQDPFPNESFKQFLARIAKEPPPEETLNDSQSEALEENQQISNLEQLRRNINRLEQENIGGKLQYHFYQMYCEMHREGLRIKEDESDPIQKDNKLSNLNQFILVTNQLITSIANNNEKDQIETNLQAFSKAANVHTFSDHLKNAAATIVSAVTALVFGVGYTIGGFAGGLRRWKTAGLASIPCAIQGFFIGSATGYQWAKRNIMGQENARNVIQSMQEEDSNSDNNSPPKTQ